MTALERVGGILDTHDIGYALIGAAALAARGVARSTFDIDLLATDHRVLEDQTWLELRAAASVDIRRGDLDDPLGGVTRIVFAAERPIDVVVGKHAWQARAIERAEHLMVGPPVVLARDLILLKLYAGGAQDLWDIRELLQQHDRVLESEVTADLSALPAELQHRWDSVRST
jgi:hypothetical protein